MQSVIDGQQYNENEETDLDQPANITTGIVNGHPDTGESSQINKHSKTKKAKTNLVKVPEKPRAVVIMEERAKQRKEKREMLKKLYEDKRSREMAVKIEE